MNNTNFFIRPLENTQFFSVMNSIIILSKILHQDNQLRILHGEPPPITIINDLCEFLANNSQREDRILYLGHELIKETDFYGSKMNESLDITFVNSMLNQIITNIVFSKFGNTFGYLAAIVNSTKHLKLHSVKKKITNNLRQQTFLNDNGTLLSLTNKTIARITEKIIFPLFPKSKSNMEIINIRYIYAQAGWILLRSAKESSDKPSFSKLIALAMNVEQGVLQGKMDPSALQIFQLPALLYYVHQNGIKGRNLKSIMVSTKFWHRVYNRLFTDINVTLGKVSIMQKRSPTFRFQDAFSKFKTRTVLAEEVLRKYCLNTTYYDDQLTDYKNDPAEYYCNGKLMPNINDIFIQQNQMIARKYYFYEIHLIHQVFDERLKQIINQKNVTIKPIQEFWKNRCFRCAAYSNRPKLSSGIDLFQISDGRASAIYALIRSKSGMRLIQAWDINSFLDEIGLNSRAKLDVPFMAEDMKSASGNDDFNSFVIHIAKAREKLFLANLKNSGYDATTTEKVVDFFKHLIPFYACAESIRESESSTQTAMACIVDSLVLVPFFGLSTSMTTKVTTATMRSVLFRLGLEMESLTLREAFKAVMKVGFRLIATDIINSFSQIITKEFIQDFGIAILRSLDPGIEFSYKLSKAGVNAVMKSWKLLQSKFSLKSLENLKSVTDIKIGSYKGFDVNVHSINGKDGYGLKSIDFQDKVVQLRKLRGYANEMPVVVVNNARRHQRFRIIDLETGKLSITEWEERDQILVNAVKPFRARLEIIKTVGLSGRGALKSALFRSNVLQQIDNRRHEALYLLHEPLFQKMLYDRLKNYVLETPDRSARDFIEYWINNSRFPKWAFNYHLTDTTLYERLRFTAFQENIKLQRLEAINRVMDIYGSQYLREVINVDPDLLFSFYNDNQLHDVISFCDQFAIANFVTTGFSRISLDDLEALYMRRALFTAAFRQYDNKMMFADYTDKYLYSKDTILSTDVLSLREGKIIDINQFTIVSLEQEKVFSDFKEEIDTSLVKVLHRIKLDHHCLAVYSDEYLPFQTEDAVLLPGIKLYLNYWKRDTINGQNVVVLNWKNVEFDKAKWITDTANTIAWLLKREQVILQLERDVLMNFDTNLLT